MVGASITKTAQMFGISTDTVSKGMIAFEKEKKCLSKAEVRPKVEVVRERPSNCKKGP